jgi:predicted DNA-binding protein with PD1-like motif
MDLLQVTPGRRFIGRLPAGSEVTDFIVGFCRRKEIGAAAFTLGGSVSCFTIGTYDPVQQVYVTETSEAARDIAACSGTVALKEGAPFVAARIVLSDERGRTSGGRLFAETRIFAGEIDLQELRGGPLRRTLDPHTGLFLLP